jgi:hypothetical protein
MRVLVTVSGWPGHWFPMVPLAWALRAAGHDVRVVCPPGQAETVGAAGLTPVPVLDGLDMVLQARLRHYWDAQAGTWPHDWLPVHPVTGAPLRSLDEFDFPAYRREHRAAILAATARSYDAAVRVARAYRPDLVLYDRLSLEGMLVARVLDVPGVLHLWGPVGVAEPGPLRLMPGDPTGTFARYGLGEPAADQVGYVLDPCPADLRPPTGPVPALPVRYVPYNGPGAARAIPGGDRPRVCLVWGTSLRDMVGPRAFLVPAILEALRELEVEPLVLMSTVDSDGYVPPPGVRVLTGYPLHLALPGCAAVIHHGGAGCVMTALAAGVPQLAVTFAAEQAANAERVAAAGAGRHVPAHRFDRDAVRAAVAELLADAGIRAAATRLREQCAQAPTPARVADELAGLA